MLMNKKELIINAAQCLLGIEDEWDYFDIAQFLDWQLDNMEDIAEGYPLEVMTRECEDEIMEEVRWLLKERVKALNEEIKVLKERL
jgi:hypothetical protein